MQDLRTLAIFVKVAERRSFVRAASDLGITQSGVSNAISRLEQQVGTRLLARTTRRVSLTEHGAAYFERCRQALAELEEAELVLKDSQLEPSGNLRIDMPVSFGRLKIVPLLGPFQGKYPHIKLRVTFTDRYIDLIEEGVDVCMRLGQLHDSSPDRPPAEWSGIQSSWFAPLLCEIRQTEADRGFDRPQLPGVYVSRNAPREGMAFHARRR
jgi:LysR family transcriptional regulator, regulator for bpeEF and oprC